jgi:hypothetical protein
MTAKGVAILLREYRSKWLGVAIGKRTTAQIECPHIIEEDAFEILTTEDEELGTDHGYGIVVTTTARSGTIDHCAGPLTRYWSAKL